MNARIAIEVKNRREARAIEQALADPEVRAFVLVVGTLLPLTERGRRRVLGFVADSLDEQARP